MASSPLSIMALWVLLGSNGLDRGSRILRSVSSGALFVGIAGGLITARWGENISMLFFGGGLLVFFITFNWAFLRVVKIEQGFNRRGQASLFVIKGMSQQLFIPSLIITIILTAIGFFVGYVFNIGPFSIT